MRVAASLKTLRSRHPKSLLVKRKGVLRVVNKHNRKFQARQG